jgi:hypothetical protein
MGIAGYDHIRIATKGGGQDGIVIGGPTRLLALSWLEQRWSPTPDSR